MFSRLCRLNCKWPVYRLFVILFFPFLYFVIRFANLLQPEDLALILAGVADVENYKENLYMLNKSISVTSQKGGVGKTTMALNLGVALAA